jgi:hypothetical protein
MRGSWGLSAAALFGLLIAAAAPAAPAGPERQLVMKGGRIYDPARIEQALGIAPRNPT